MKALVWGSLTSFKPTAPDRPRLACPGQGIEKSICADRFAIAFSCNGLCAHKIATACDKGPARRCRAVPPRAVYDHMRARPALRHTLSPDDVKQLLLTLAGVPTTRACWRMLRLCYRLKDAGSSCLFRQHLNLPRSRTCEMSHS